jgi:hypothetical protein
MVWIIPVISFFRLVAPPLQFRVVEPFPGMGCMVPQLFAAGGSRSYPEFWVVTGGPWCPEYITPTPSTSTLCILWAETTHMEGM